ECSKTVIPRRNDEESAFQRPYIVLKSRFLASLEMTGRAKLCLFEHSHFEAEADLSYVNFGSKERAEV
ncbi:MAG: hypothetical protein Q7N50_09525, partial [Armatimonadota bacterium]|nr:hypothetical protein [Armatimonadota bacterium]